MFILYTYTQKIRESFEASLTSKLLMNHSITKTNDWLEKSRTITSSYVRTYANTRIPPAKFLISQSTLA